MAQQTKHMTEEEVKELIADIEARVKYFQSCIGLFNDNQKVMQYFDGKRSEAYFIMEKLKAIIE